MRVNLHKLFRLRTRQNGLAEVRIENVGEDGENIETHTLHPKP
jgi:hypothetical protein